MRTIDKTEDQLLKLYNQQLSTFSEFQRSIRAKNEQLDSDFRDIYNSSSC